MRQKTLIGLLHHGPASFLRSLPIHRCHLYASSFFSSSAPSSDFCDVLILGGGMVGGALACVLGSHPAFRDKRTIVLERGAKLPTSVSADEPFSNRVCELSPATIDFLHGVGVWDLLKNQRVKPVTRMQVWDAASDSYIVFDSSSNATDSSATGSSLEAAVSWTVENDVTTRAIESRIFALARDGANVELRHGAKVEKITLPGIDGVGNSQWPRVTLSDGSKIDTRLIVGADGANSAARAAAKIKTMDYDYGQMGIVATVRLEQAFGNTVAWQRFLSSGPVALLPLDDYHSSLVWSVGVDEAKRLIAMEEGEFAERLNAAISAPNAAGGEGSGAGAAAVRQMAGKYGDLLPTTSGRQIPPKIVGINSGSLAMFPLKMSHATEYVKPGLALVGDAAHRIHPMAGQGVNLGFGDAAKLAEVLAEGVSRGGDLGSASILQPYETSRQRKVLPLIAGLQALHHLYGSTWSPVVALRSFGLQTVDALPVLKSAFAKFAMTH